MVWYDYRDGNPEIYYKRSTNGGESWETDTRLTNHFALSYDPCIAVSGTAVHVFWTDDRAGNTEIYYKRSADGGTTWSEDLRLTNAIRCSESPSVAVSDSVIHLTWYDERNDPSGNWYTDIYYKQSTDNGLTWGDDKKLTNDLIQYYSGFPCIAVSGSMVHVAWEDTRNNGSGEIYYNRSTDGGLTWEADTPLTDNPADQWDPCISVSDLNVHVVWFDNRNGSTNNEIYYRRSTDGGVTWEPETRLTNNSSESQYPTIAVSGQAVHVAWHDNRDTNYEIYYKRSTDGGVSWEQDTRLTNASGTSQLAFLALYDSVVHVVWNDNRNGNWEIYYKNNPTGNPIIVSENDLVKNPGKLISIWPNPASNYVNMAFDNLYIGNKLLTIRNMLGEPILRRQIQNNQMLLDITDIPDGLYFVTVYAENKQYASAKLIIL